VRQARCVFCGEPVSLITKFACLRFQCANLSTYSAAAVSTTIPDWRNRRPEIEIAEAWAYTVPGIVAHASALKDGESTKIPDLG